MRLSVQIEFDKTLEIETPKSDVIVGRTQTSDLVIPHESISRNHCRIEAVKEKLFITDLGSSNGTYIDGKKLPPQKRTPFLSSSHLKIGKLECELSFQGLNNEALARAESIKAQVNKNATMTMRIGRLDLNNPPITSEMEKKNKELLIKGPRNPVTEDIKASAKLEYKTPRAKFFILFLILGLINYYLITVAAH
jgi:pSer/pThr/pTyr-binding forkhead associated (FHA) protein